MKNLIFVSLLILSAFTMKAQNNIFPVMSVQAEYKPLVNGLSTDTSLFVAKVQVSVLDTTSISKVHVKMGTTKGAGDLIEKEFTYDISGNLGDGTFYSRIGKKIFLNLGNYAKMDHFYGEIRIEKNDNSLSDPINFSR